ncbi:MAG: bifunctional serine/threonine-protein kinase/formylglycine-generating enzyme family protein [Candidatus Xenobia bacterium]
MLAPGSLLQDRFTIEKVLGEGGMGTVYLAHDTHLGGKPVAIKEMVLQARNPARREAVRRQFEKEARILASLSHPGVVSVSYAFQEDNFYLVMAWIDGETLQHQGRVAWRQAVDWGIELCSILAYLHHHSPPVVFRDLKPSNIMLDRDGRLHLIDFGVAHLLDPDATITQMGAGTPAFAALEQFGEGEVDGRADIYGLGATLYALMTDSTPPPAGQRVMRDEPMAKVSDLQADAPPQLDEVLQRCMALKAGDRYQDVGELETALRRLRQGTALATPVRSLRMVPLLLAVTVAVLWLLHSASPPALRPELTAADGSRLLLVPAGSFSMGFDDNFSDARPVHSVSLDSYYIARTDVTNAQFRRFVQATGYRAAGDWATCAKASGEDAPVVEVSWFDAQAYCRWAGLRLPTEAEWERAARGTDGRRFPWGNTWEADHCWCLADSGGHLHAVGTKPADLSPVGCLDMAGNAWNWCSSQARPYPYHANDGREDPRGRDCRVLRGGDFMSHWQHCTGYNRDFVALPTEHNPGWSFRGARTP